MVKEAMAQDIFQCRVEVGFEKLDYTEFGEVRLCLLLNHAMNRIILTFRGNPKENSTLMKVVLTDISSSLYRAAM